MQIVSTSCNQLQPFATICNHSQPIATNCNHSQPVATSCNQLQPIATIRNHSKQLVIGRDQMRPFATSRNHSHRFETSPNQHIRTIVDIFQPWWIFVRLRFQILGGWVYAHDLLRCNVGKFIRICPYLNYFPASDCFRRILLTREFRETPPRFHIWAAHVYGAILTQLD